jgi:hypothetical protein
MRAKEYALLEMAVRSGIEYGYTRAHKHTEAPSETAVIDAIQMAVMNDINDWFSFDEIVEND